LRNPGGRTPTEKIPGAFEDSSRIVDVVHGTGPAAERRAQALGLEEGSPPPGGGPEPHKTDP